MFSYNSDWVDWQFYRLLIKHKCHRISGTVQKHVCNMLEQMTSTGVYQQVLIYKYKTEIESLPENCFSCFNLNKFHQSRRKALFFFFLHFSFVFFIQIYIDDIVLNFSLFYLCQKIQQHYNASVLNRMMVILSENWESLFDLTAISLELFVPSLKQTLRDVHDCLRDKEQEMIGSKAMRRKNQDMVSNCLVRVSNFQYTQVTTPSIQKFLESERLIM